VLDELDHSDEFRHDEELDLQADKILFQRLALAFSVDGGPMGEEAGLVASGLEMVYRASRPRVALSFNEVGEAMLPLLVEMIQNPEPRAEDMEAVVRKDVGSESSVTSEEKMLRVTEEVKRAPTKHMDDAHDQEEADDGSDRDTVEDEKKPAANGHGPLDGDARDQDAYSEEKKGDSYENLAHAGMDEARRKHGADANCEVEVETVHSEADRGNAVEVEYSTEQSRQAGNDHAYDENGEESKPQVRFNEDAEVQQFLPEQPLGTSPLAVSRVLKVLRYFSRVLSAMIPMAHHPGLLDALVYQLSRRSENSVTRGLPGSHVHFGINEGLDEHQRQALHQDALGADLAAVRIDAMATVVNLACAEENKILLVYHPGLLDGVLDTANSDPSEEAREHAAIVLMNLAYAEENKVHMAGRDYLLDTIIRLIGDPSPFTRRYASAALFTLACVAANTSRMAKHRDGEILTALVQVLLEDPIDEARINAAEALFNMARNSDSDDDTVMQMGNHTDLLRALAQAVVSDYSADVRAYAARALEWLSADLHHPMPCHNNLLSALTTSAQWTKTTCIAEAFKTQSTISDNRAAMVHHDGLLDALADLALMDGINDEEVSTCAITAIERLTKEDSTRHIMVKNEGVMTALTKATFTKSGLDADDGGLDADMGASVDGLSLVSGVSTSMLTKNALKNLADAL